MLLFGVGRKEQSEGRDHQPKHFSSARLCACLFVACRNVAAENKISCSPPASRPEKSLPRRRHRRRGASEVNESTERQSSLRIDEHRLASYGEPNNGRPPSHLSGVRIYATVILLSSLPPILQLQPNRIADMSRDLVSPSTSLLSAIRKGRRQERWRDSNSPDPSSRNTPSSPADLRHPDSSGS